LLDVARRSRLAGLILAPPMSERPELIKYLSSNGVHLVRIISAAEDPQDGFACVYVDDRDAAYAITEHLIQLGHERIGFLWGGTAHLSSFERYKGYQLALERYGIKEDPALVLPGDYSFDDGFRGTRKLLSLEHRPTAIFGSNDEIAAGALVAAKSLGIDVPNQLSIAGFEDSPFSRQSWPALTTARQATEEIARAATFLLIAELRPNSVSQHNIVGRSRGFTPELVVRGSTARAPASAG
jgi:LacI family transcriptional regulator